MIAKSYRKEAKLKDKEDREKKIGRFSPKEGEGGGGGGGIDNTIKEVIEYTDINGEKKVTNKLITVTFTDLNGNVTNSESFVDPNLAKMYIDYIHNKTEKVLKKSKLIRIGNAPELFANAMQNSRKLLKGGFGNWIKKVKSEEIDFESYLDTFIKKATKIIKKIQKNIKTKDTVTKKK